MTETVNGQAADSKPSVSRAKGGLNMERIYTTPGVHPYDEVTWERRDVVQTNWKTGETVFEQRGVEFPDFWSVNASTIVTTKYFRGAVGTEQREWSLKQLIDRVVLTYTAAGKEHGYFATDAEAETFEHELTWMLLHQVFSFNSPVWFNVGTSAPQQVSACQPYDALVSTPAGLVPIGELVERNAVGTKVYDAHGVTGVVAVKSNGVKDVLRVHLKSGQALDVTADHLVWRSSGDGTGRFVEAGTLNPGDQLEWHRRPAFGESEIVPLEVAEAARAGRLHSQSVPDSLFTAPLPVVAAYLRSLLHVEGAVSVAGDSADIALSAPSEEFARGVQLLLGRFGICASIAAHGEAGLTVAGGWLLRVQSPGDLRGFVNDIGLDDAGTAQRLESALDAAAPAGTLARDVEQVQIVRIEHRGDMPVYDIQTESGEYLSGSLRVHNCFILAVDDTMGSILNWYREEGMIFKGGSGAGLNLSRIRSSKELLSSGGTASGPVSFMRGADASAGTIKSGGATRRAAKMVVLDVDHPDIEEFVETKAREEDKIRALRDAGFEMDLGGRDITSVQYQNANNSVRVSDTFMRAVESGEEFGLRARGTGEVIESVNAEGLFRKIAQAAWACADPGIQYDDTINDWHTNPETGRITASNPCFPADQRVMTDRGLIRIGELVARAAQGETFGVYTNDVTSEADPQARVSATTPTRYMVTGTNEIVELEFSDGSLLRCTPNHRVWTQNQGWVRAEDLTADDRVVRSLEHAARSMASEALPEAALQAARRVVGQSQAVELPHKWSDDLAHYLGWLVGDGRLTSSGAVTYYGSGDDRDHVLARHQAFLANVAGAAGQPIVQANGRLQLRVDRSRLRTFLEGLGVNAGRSSTNVVPHALFEAPDAAVAAFLRGLFDARGCVVNEVDNGTRHVGLGTRSQDLVRDTQEMLAGFGIRSRIHATVMASTESSTDIGDIGESDANGFGGPSYDLRITGTSLAGFAALIGFSLPDKQYKLAQLLADHTFGDEDETVSLSSRRSAGYETTYNLTEPRNHSYVVSGIVVANCSEYMSLDNSSCNLASLNLLKFLKDDDTFDAVTFAKAVEVIITAMDISICFADFPTEPIGETTRKYRQLGIGYANLGALLMASGLAYDSEAGRAFASAVTSLMTGTAYKRSAELAGIVGPYEGFARNAEAHTRVMRKHAAANDGVRTFGQFDESVHREATKAWQAGLEIGATNGWRNAQASVLAPTGCLTGDTLVVSDRGLVRLSELGDVWGARWQPLDTEVATDEGPRQASQFFVNGEEATRKIRTGGGYEVQGTLGHRIKVVDRQSGAWAWKRLSDIEPGDVVPIQMGTLVGEPRNVPLPVLDQAYYAGDRALDVPSHVDAELAELVGYFMGDGSLHAKGIRLRVADTDLDVVDRIRVLAKGLFNLAPKVSQQQGYQEVVLQSVRLARWWKAAGFAKDLPGVDHSGKGWTPRVPAAIRETNDPAVYAAFLRGVFEADGSVTDGVPMVSTASQLFAADLRALLLTLGLPTTTCQTVSGSGGDQFQLRLGNLSHVERFADLVGFLSARKGSRLAANAGTQSGQLDRIYLPDEVWGELAPIGHELRQLIQQATAHGKGISRDLALRLYGAVPDARLGHALQYLFEEVADNIDGGVQPTYDLSVPDNVTYVANGFVSHNTIGFMMDCDTTGIEPDFSLVKFKKLVGGGSMQIVNQTIPRALRKLGYSEETIEAIVEHIAEHGHVIGAPGLRPEHYDVFDCAMGERSIAPMGHVRMMAAAQPFLSGAISKTVNLPENATVEEIEDVYLQGWKLGLKALAVYRDNCKVGQPLSDAKAKGSDSAVEAGGGTKTVVEYRPTRRRLPKSRQSRTTSFTVGGAEGYMTAGAYDDGGLGEVFLKLGKQGSTLAGVMDAFSIAVSIGLQYGVPLETFVSKFTNLRFDPAGLTDDPDVRMSQSIMDYIFRRLALDYMPFEDRSALGIHTAEERVRALDTGSYEEVVDAEELEDELETRAQTAPVAGPAANPTGAARPPAVAQAAPADVHSSAELMEKFLGTAADAPMCFTCGTKMRPAGSCYVCEGCGSTSGCS